MYDIKSLTRALQYWLRSIFNLDCIRFKLSYLLGTSNSFDLCRLNFSENGHCHSGMESNQESHLIKSISRKLFPSRVPSQIYSLGPNSANIFLQIAATCTFLRLFQKLFSKTLIINSYPKLETILNCILVNKVNCKMELHSRISYFDSPYYEVMLWHILECNLRKLNINTFNIWNWICLWIWTMLFPETEHFDLHCQNSLLQIVYFKYFTLFLILHSRLLYILLNLSERYNTLFFKWKYLRSVFLIDSYVINFFFSYLNNIFKLIFITFYRSWN